MVMELATDPYIPLIGSLPAAATAEEALAWIQRQRGRLAEGIGLSFAIADAVSDVAVGTIGLWLRELSSGRASAGYSVSPAGRGRGVPELYRIELHIEPWNTGSIHVAESAGYQREGLLRSYQQIGDSRRDMELYATTRPV